MPSRDHPGVLGARQRALGDQAEASHAEIGLEIILVRVPVPEFDVHDRREPVPVGGRKSPRIKIHVLDEVDVQERQRPARGALDRIVVDVGDGDVVEIEAVFHRIPAPDHQSVHLVVDPGDAGEPGDDAAHIAAGTGGPPDLLIGEATHTGGLLFGVGEITGGHGDLLVLLHLHAQLEGYLHECDALRLDHHVRMEFGQIVLAADLQDIRTDRQAWDLEIALIVGQGLELCPLHLDQGMGDGGADLFVQDLSFEGTGLDLPINTRFRM